MRVNDSYMGKLILRPSERFNTSMKLKFLLGAMYFTLALAASGCGGMRAMTNDRQDRLLGNRSIVLWGIRIHDSTKSGFLGNPSFIINGPPVSHSSPPVFGYPASLNDGLESSRQRVSLLGRWSKKDSANTFEGIGVAESQPGECVIENIQFRWVEGPWRKYLDLKIDRQFSIAARKLVYLGLFDVSIVNARSSISGGSREYSCRMNTSYLEGGLMEFSRRFPSLWNLYRENIVDDEGRPYEW